MADFRYQALNAAGVELSGTIAAPDERGAVAALKGQGLHVMSVQAASGADAQSPATASQTELTDQEATRRRGRRVSPNDLTFFTRQLANLVRGGLPMMRIIDALIDNTENARLHQVLSTVRAEVAGGAALYEAMAQHPRVFGPLYVSLVQAGEMSGELATVLARLAEFSEQDLERRSQIRAALAYPALLIVVGSSIVAGLVTFLIPKFQVLFAEFDKALPIPTQIVLAISGFLSKTWWALILGGILLVWLHRRWTSTPSGRLTWDRWRLAWPLLGRLQHRAASSRMARTLATLLRGGVSILDALQIVQGVVGNAWLGDAIAKVGEGVREGESLGLELRRTGRFPNLLWQMVLVGEETGEVDTALDTVADAFDVEVSNKLKGLVALVEPAVLLVMGGIVALVVFAMLMPIFQLNEGVG